MTTNTSHSDGSIKRDVRAALVSGVARDHRRTRGRRRIAVGSALALAAIAAPITVQMTEDHGLAVDEALAIASTGDGELITVSVTDVTADPEVMERQLLNAGVNAEVEVVPVSPSLRGTLVGYESEADLEGLDPEDLAEVLELSTKGRYWIAVGRQAAADEVLLAGMDPTLNGEPLHCLASHGMSAADAVEAVEHAGLEASVRLETFSGSGNGSSGYSTEVDHAVAGAVTGFAWLDGSSVAVFVDPEATPTSSAPYC